MDKMNEREKLLDLLDEHNAQEVIFVECNGCDTCDKIISIGKKLFTEKDKRGKQVCYGSARKSLLPFFEEYGYRLSFKEANEHKDISCTSQQYYQLRKEYRESIGVSVEKPDYVPIKKELMCFFKKHGHHLTFKEADNILKIGCTPQRYYQLRKEYREGEGE